MKVVRRRRIGRLWWGLGMFVGVFLFTFLIVKSQTAKDEVDAASLAGFDPGLIITDWQMANYTSMTEAEIQKFLTEKNSCPNTNRGYYDLLSNSSSYQWHFKNGHFVCLSEELFGDGEVIGSGETAAHILWQAAQDYRINPQALIVLLQKETGLITDPIPNNGDYRKATGYGCPDTAPCSAEYYGFKNQVRRAAALFRTVLDGGWTNYPLGENYVQYNPDPDCGGTVVNIRSLATSALYRYTPYQPNASALAAGYGYGDYCSAYGNRNFYQYFEDWFGGIRDTKEAVAEVKLGEWQEMMIPRVMEVAQQTMLVNPIEGKTYNEFAKFGQKYYLTTKIDIIWGGKRETCLRTAADTKDNVDRCIIMSRMAETNQLLYEVEEIELTEFDVLNDTYKYDLRTGKTVQSISAKQYPTINFAGKVNYEGEDYYQTAYDAAEGNEYFVPAKDLKVVQFTEFLYPRNMMVTSDADFVNVRTGEVCKSVKTGYVKKFTTKVLMDGVYYYRTAEDSEEDSRCAIRADVMGEAPAWSGLKETEVNFVDFLYPREMAFRLNIYSTNVMNGTSCERLYEAQEIAKFTTKIKVGPNYYYRTEEESLTGAACVLASSKLREL